MVTIKIFSIKLAKVTPRKCLTEKNIRTQILFLILHACGISSVGGRGIFAIAAGRRRGSDGDNSVFALTLTTFEILSDIILWRYSSKYGYVLSSLPYAFVDLFDFLLYFQCSLN